MGNEEITKAEIKKTLYRTKPDAKLIHIGKDGLYYKTHVLEDAYDLFFLVPLNDMGDAKWFPFMPAQLLLRYLID